MRDYTLTHLSDPVLLRDLATLITEERCTLASVLAHISEVDARKLYVPLGYSSMFAYCVDEFRLSEDAAYKRIQAARAGRQFPILFTELAEGRLHMTAVCMLAPHLTTDNVEALVGTAAHRRQSEIHRILAGCHTPSAGQIELAAQQVHTAAGSPARVEATQDQLAAQQVDGVAAAQELGGLIEGQLAAQQVGVSGPLLSQAEPLVPLMVRPEIRDRVRSLQALLSHAIPSGDVSQVLDRALDLLAEEVEKRRFGTGAGPMRRRRTGNRNRYIPAPVRHAVWNRDAGRCTFVGANGRRCNSEHFLEFDHVDPRNREDTVSGLRLRCRAHNQYEAERVFGTEFMKRKRAEARRAADQARAEKERDKARARVTESSELEDQIQEFLSALRGLGVRGGQAQRAAAHARTIEHATLADRIRAAVQFHGECIMRSPRAARALHHSD